MQKLACIVLAVLCAACYGQESSMVETPLIGDVRNCPTTSPVFPNDPLYRMEVLAGGGYDALRSLDMGQVHVYNYSRCLVSNDGRYLLPDSAFLIPVLKSSIEAFSEVIEHWDDYKSTTSSTITLEAGFASIISGKFSEEYLSVKSHMYWDKSVMTRVQLRNVLFKVKIQPESELHPAFKSRLFEIAANIQNNNQEFAEYLAELTVREYGTHYITSMDAGAVLSQVDYVSSTAIEDFSKKTLTASASANFLGKFKFGSSFQHSNIETHTQRFIDNRTYSEVHTWGGPPFGPNLTVDEWEKGVPSALVAVDRSGDPLHFAITPTTLPEIPETTVYDVAFLISKAITRYYKVNTRHGCTDRNSPNFDFQANVDDQSCQPPNTNFTFGGIYQTCTYVTQQHEDICNSGPQPMKQINPLTGDTSCRDPYVPVMLHSGQFSHTFRRRECEKHCSWWSCHYNCLSRPYTTTINYETYWCVAHGQVEQTSGYLFGGFYTSSDANPFVGSKSCPKFFMPLHFGEDIEICVSSNYELGSAYSVPFAGFESCTTGNPLAITNPSLDDPSSWPHDCPTGFSQHMVAVEENCEINFCVKTGSFNQLRSMPPNLPPYRKLQQNPNATDTLVVIGTDGEIWYRNQDGQWVKDYGDSQNGEFWVENDLNLGPIANSSAENDTNTQSLNSPRSSSSASSNLSHGGVAGISVAVTTVFFGSVIALVFAGYSIRRRRDRNNREQVHINESASQAYGSP